MYIKKVKYEDYNGVQKEKTLFFNLSQKELIDFIGDYDGGFQDYLREVTESKDQTRIVNFITNFVAMAYGEKSGDGEDFLKEDENGRKLFNKFKQTAAYEALWDELSGDSDAAIDFFMGVIPSKAKANITPEMIEAAKRGELPEVPQITQN